MTHVLESEFGESVRHALHDLYGVDNVHKEYYLKDAQRYVDFYVQGPFVNFTIEVEDTFEGLIKSVGQTLIYAGELDAMPVIVVPPEHFDEPELSHLTPHVMVVEYDG